LIGLVPIVIGTYRCGTVPDFDRLPLLGLTGSFSSRPGTLARYSVVNTPAGGRSRTL